MKRACAAVAVTTGARACAVASSRFGISHTGETAGVLFARLAGPRAVVVLTFAAPPTWLDQIPRPETCGVDLVSDTLDLVVALQPAAAVGSLAAYVATTLDAHLAQASDEARFPVLDDATLGALFGA